MRSSSRPLTALPVSQHFEAAYPRLKDVVEVLVVRDLTRAPSVPGVRKTCHLNGFIEDEFDALVDAGFLSRLSRLGIDFLSFDFGPSCRRVRAGTPFRSDSPVLGLEEILALARRLRGTGIRFAFSVRGRREADLRAAVKPDDENVSFAPFVDEGALARRLGAADVHAVSLRPEWTGTVVPSKFQAALAAGRPVLFAGSPGAAPARWIAELGLGWTLSADPASLDETAAALLALAGEPAALAALKDRCHAAYAERFSRERAVARWDAALRALCA